MLVPRIRLKINRLLNFLEGLEWRLNVCFNTDYSDTKYLIKSKKIS